MRGRRRPMCERRSNASRRVTRRFHSVARMPLLLPFTTFGEAAAFDLDVELVCRCRRIVVVDGSSPFFRDRRIMDARFTCTTILPHGARCSAVPTVYIRKRGRRGWTLADHSRAIAPATPARPADARQDLPRHRPARRSRPALRPGLRPALHGVRRRARRATLGPLPRPARRSLRVSWMSAGTDHARPLRARYARHGTLQRGKP